MRSPDLILYFKSHYYNFFIISGGDGWTSFFKKDLYEMFYWILPNFILSIKFSIASLLISWIVLLLTNLLFFEVVVIVPIEFLLDGKSNFIFCGVMWVVVIFFWEDWILRGFIWITSSFNRYFFELSSLVIDYYFYLADLCADSTLLFRIFIKFFVDPRIIFSLAITSYPSFPAFFPCTFAFPKSPMIFIFD